MIATRYIIVSYTDRGNVAYDTYDTMNRIEYFRGNGCYTMGAASFNLRLLQQLRWNEIALGACIFVAMTPDEEGAYGHQMWFRRHGVEVDMGYFEEQEAEEQAIIEAAEVVESAHLLWDAMAAEGLIEDYEDVETVVISGSSAEDPIDLTEAVPVMDWYAAELEELDGEIDGIGEFDAETEFHF